MIGGEAVDLGLTHLIFEMDCKLAVDEIREVPPEFSDIGTILTECRRIISMFPNFRVWVCEETKK